MMVFLLIIGLILCLMVGTGIGKLRYETAKWLRRRQLRKKPSTRTKKPLKLFDFSSK